MTSSLLLLFEGARRELVCTVIGILVVINERGSGVLTAGEPKVALLGELLLAKEFLLLDWGTLESNNALRLARLLWVFFLIRELERIKNMFLVY